MIVPKDLFDKDKVKKYKVEDDGTIIVNIMGVIWFTNLDISKRHEDLILYKEYKKKDYPKYDNYDGIEVPKVNEIPKDYFGNIGVPITYVDSYNPEQFEIVGISGALAKSFEDKNGKKHSGRFYVNGERKYDRVVIRRKQNEN